MTRRKTEFTYNEADFVEDHAGMRELTVTITLEEYRDLISEDAHMRDEIYRLRDENEQLKTKIDAAIKPTTIKVSEIIQEIGSALADFDQIVGAFQKGLADLCTGFLDAGRQTKKIEDQNEHS